MVCKFRKIKTNILGLDKLFFEGLDLSAEHTVIVIRGDGTTEKTLLGMQLIYGISQSLYKLEATNFDLNPKFISTYMQKPYLDDLFLDIIIAQCIQKLTQKYVCGELGEIISNDFARTFFNYNRILCKDYPHNIYEKLPISAVEHETDKLICEEAIYYSNRTNSLHFRVDDHKSDEENILYHRRYDSMNGYFIKDVNQKMSLIGNILNFPLNNMTNSISENIENLKPYSKQKQNALYAIDLGILIEKNVQTSSILKVIKEFKSVSRVLVLIFPEKIPIPDSLVDIIIDLKTKILSDYLLQYLSITKNRIQQSALGWHQYKRRDYGIEIYPSLHTYFQQRRYLQRALVYTHSNVITDTFQQYLDKNEDRGSNVSYDKYMNMRENIAEEYYKALYPQYSSDFNSIDILERILLSDTTFSKKSSCERLHATDLIYGYRGGATAVIGEANTYKRFLTFGGIFSSALNKEHTLLLLLNKDDSTIRRRLACPARAKKEKDCKDCKDCYSYIHFMNICMGNITPDEFIYFLERQIELGFKCNKKIQRIIIDDLYILDFCFPLLKGNALFLSALVSVCRDRNIALYILCDKNGDSVSALRAVSDNVICTDRDENGKLLIYIERFAGYNNTPSKIYCGRINKVKDLFECYKKRDDKERDILYYALSHMEIEDQPVSSMEKFRASQEAKTIANIIKKK